MRSRSLKNIHCYQRYTLCPLKNNSTRALIKLTSRVVMLEMVVDLEEGHLPGQMLFVTSVSRGTISVRTSGQM